MGLTFVPTEKGGLDMTRDEATSLLYQYKYFFEHRRKRNRYTEQFAKALGIAIKSLQVESEWITDSKPRKDGTYMVTLDAFSHHRYIKIFNYGKPLLPNREVKGKCWYRADAEWGDIVYDDGEILAWMPLPTPYEESEVGE